MPKLEIFFFKNFVRRGQEKKTLYADRKKKNTNVAQILRFFTFTIQIRVRIHVFFLLDPDPALFNDVFLEGIGARFINGLSHFYTVNTGIIGRRVLKVYLFSGFFFYRDIRPLKKNNIPA